MKFQLLRHGFQIALILFFGLAAQAQSPDPGPAVRYREHVQVLNPSREVLRALVESNPELIVDHVSSTGYEVYGPRGLEKELERREIPYVPLDLAVSKKQTSDYPSPEQCVQKMKDLQAKYPQWVQLIEIGKSVKGRPLLVARITAQPNRTDLPEFKYVANMHGDEIAGRELMLWLMADLLANYGTDTRITRLMDQAHVYIMPSLNPDGAAARVRFNANGVDLNRSFPDRHTNDNVNSMDQRQPEVQAMMRFQAGRKFKVSANFHGGAEVVNYPWDGTATLFPLDNFVKLISANYADGVPYMKLSSEFPGGITNGYQWYPVYGGMQDWSYAFHNDIQVTIELTMQKWPRYSTLDATYRANRDSLLGYIESVFDR